MTVAIKGPHRIDLHVGSRVRLRRKMLGLSQEDLATAIDLTFQQVQKYEKGSNRISSSKLYEIAVYLKAPIGYFFEGIDEGQNEEVSFSQSSSEQSVNTFLATTEGIELAQAFPRLKSAKIKRRVLELCRSLAEDDEQEISHIAAQ